MVKNMGGSGKRSLRSLPMVLAPVQEPSASWRFPLPPIASFESDFQEMKT